MSTITYIALMRGINVGGKNKLPMADLTRLFTNAGASNVKTYIQSGNVVFDIDKSMLDDAMSKVRASIESEFGHQVPIVIRSVDQMTRAMEFNPYLAKGLPLDTIHVLFLADEPSAELVSKLDFEKYAPVTFQVIGREIYAHFPAGVGATKFTNTYFDRALKTVSTMRNWRTVCTLAEMEARPKPA